MKFMQSDKLLGLIITNGMVFTILTKNVLKLKPEISFSHMRIMNLSKPRLVIS